MAPLRQVSSEELLSYTNRSVCDLVRKC